MCATGTATSTPAPFPSKPASPLSACTRKLAILVQAAVRETGKGEASPGIAFLVGSMTNSSITATWCSHPWPALTICCARVGLRGEIPLVRCAHAGGGCLTPLPVRGLVDCQGSLAHQTTHRLPLRCQPYSPRSFVLTWSFQGLELQQQELLHHSLPSMDLDVFCSSEQCP